ncbi:MAG: radical SAM protein [Desulfobulbaceae bacterium]|nr:radical SAM protein [Desulfobulbaceae bacterium]HIJ78962.1 radical SAM protein [Deltaproteobacteria bacterium]
MSCLTNHWGVEFSQKEIARTRISKGLLSLELELSRICNLRCIYCYAASGLAVEGELAFSEIQDVIGQAAALGAQKIIVLGGGEPFLYPRLFEVIEAIQQKGMQVDIFTNGTLITPAKARELYARKVAVVIKMNSRQATGQDYLAGRKGTLAEIEQGLAALQEAGYPDADHPLGIQTIICKQNYDELPDLWRWARRQNIIPYVEVMTMQGRATENLDLEVAPAAIKNMFETLAKIDAAEFGNNWTPHPPLVASQCARHEYSCTVTSVGDVYPCPGVSVSAGNIRQQSLAEIIGESPLIQDLRNIRTKIKGKCSACDLNEYCYGCRGHAYQVTGDYLAEDPLCWLKG